MAGTFVDRNDIHQALETLKSGGLILYPTDTIWGIGCDATNPDAVERIFALKGRDKAKSMVVLLHNDYQLANYVEEVPEIAYELIEVTDRPLTIVFDKAKNLAENVVASDGSVGIRVVNHPFCEQLLQRFKKPIVSTSANLSGHPSASVFDEIDEQVKQGVDYIVNFGQEVQEKKQPSVIMRLESSGKFEFLRK